jgi:hypothetical protein
VYEFDVHWTYTYPNSPDVPKVSHIAIGFVKRGNSWYFRDWGRD